MNEQDQQFEKINHELDNRSKPSNVVKDKAEEAVKAQAKQKATQVAKTALKSAAKRAGAWIMTTAGTVSGWWIAVIVLLVIIVVIIAIGVFAYFAAGAAGNSYHKAAAKNDPQRIELLKLMETPSKENSNYKVVNVTSERDKEFLKNGGTRENPSLQPDLRLIQTLLYLANGTEESKQNGFEGFGYVEVSHIISAYEDMPINREKGADTQIYNNISAHKKGQAMDVSALGMVKSKCKCGPKTPVKVAWQDDPPLQEDAQKKAINQQLDLALANSQNPADAFSNLTTTDIEIELGIPRGTFSQPSIDLMGEYSAKVTLAEGFGLPSNTFVPVDNSDQAKNAFVGTLKTELGINGAQLVYSGEKTTDSFFYQASREVALKDTGLEQVAKISDESNQENPQEMLIQNTMSDLESAFGIPEDALSIHNNSAEEFNQKLGGGTFMSSFGLSGNVVEKLDLIDIAKNLIKKDIEKKGNLPKDELKKTTQTKAKNQWWQSDSFIDSLAKNMNLKSNSDKANLKTFVANPDNDQALESLALSKGLELVNSNFKLTQGSAQKIYNIISGKEKNADGSVMDANAKKENTLAILNQSKVFINMEKQYKLPTGTFATIISNGSDQEKINIIKDIGLSKFAKQFSLDDGKKNSLSSILAGGFNPNNQDQLTNILNGIPTIKNYADKFGLNTDSFAKYILGSKTDKENEGKKIATKDMTKKLDIVEKTSDQVTNQALGIISKKAGISSSQAEALMTFWFPSKEMKDNYNSLSQEEKEAYNKARKSATVNILGSSAIISQKLAGANISSTLISDYFNAEPKEKQSVLINGFGGKIEKTLNLKAGAASNLANILSDNTLKSADKKAMIAKEFENSKGIVSLENNNNLPYRMMAELFVSNEPDKINNLITETGYSVINAKIGLDYYDPNDKDIVNWDPKNPKQDKFKRYSIQNVLNGKIKPEELLLHTNYVSEIESNYKLEKGTVGALIFNQPVIDPLSRTTVPNSSLYQQIGYKYLNDKLIGETNDELNLVAQIALTDGDPINLTNSFLDNEIGKEFLGKYGLDPKNDEVRNSITILTTAKVKSEDGGYRDSFDFEKKQAKLTMSSNIIGNKLAEKYGLDKDDSINAVKNMFQNDYSGADLLIEGKIGSTIDNDLGLPKGTVNSFYQSTKTGNYDNFVNTSGAGALEAKYDLPQGTFNEINNGIKTDDWSGAESLGIAYAGSKLDKALGVPTGTSYGTYMLLATGNPMALAMTFAGPIINDAISSITSAIPGLGSVFGLGGLGKCKGNTNCYKDTARNNVHTSVKNLLYMQEYTNDNDLKVIQLIVYNEQRDVTPFIDDGTLDKFYGKNRLPNYGLFAMTEAYQQVHIAF